MTDFLSEFKISAQLKLSEFPYSKFTRSIDNLGSNGKDMRISLEKKETRNYLCMSSDSGVLTLYLSFLVKHCNRLQLADRIFPTNTPHLNINRQIYSERG
ncbi:MAG: hypothetical protein ABIS36_22450 [Chryseolinea sp.]